MIARIVRLPAVHFLACLIAGSWIHSRFPLSVGLPFRMAMVAGSCVLITGLAIAWAAISRMRRHRTTVEPGQRPTALVTNGVFAYSRNPIYVALVLGVAGFAVMADSVWLLIAAFVLWIMLGMVIRSEERVIAEIFPAEYGEYKRRVRRWL